MDQIKIGKFISKLRKEKNLTQDDLAEKLMVSTKSISRWETGRNMPDYSILKDLCSILDISVNELINGERIQKDKIIEEYDSNLINVLKEYKRMKKVKNVLKILLILIGVGFFSVISLFMSVVGFAGLTILGARVEISTDASKYNDFMGENAIERYKIKWGMDETIFPEKIKDLSKVQDYKMVYYDPWDKQYISYLVMEYDEEDYNKEVQRLHDYNSTEYKGYYSVTGFTKHELLAMYADSYNGFIYALDLGDNKICYVELIFCNYMYDLDYNKYINKDYLPDGFNAKDNNPYQKQKNKEQGILFQINMA